MKAQTPLFRPCPVRDISDSRFTSVVQDSKGWIWYGSTSGKIFRYDGMSFQEVARHADLPDTSSVTTLFEWQGLIWAGFKNGQIATIPMNGSFAAVLGKNISKGNKFEAWKPEEGTPQKSIQGFAHDDKGNLWFGTYGEGIYVWKNGRLYQFNQADDGLGSDEIYALVGDRQGRIWAATDAGISVCSIQESGQKQVIRLGLESGLPDEIITALNVDYQGNVWIGTHDKGLAKYDIFSGIIQTITPDWPYGNIQHIATYGTQEAWVNVEKNGLIRVNVLQQKTDLLPETHFLNKTRITGMMKDREGLLWIMADNGQCYAAHVRFGLLETPDGHVQTVLCTNNGKLWAGSATGLNILQKDRIQPVFQQKENIISLWESPTTGNIWVGTFGNGIYILNAEGRTLKHLTEKDGLPNGNILSIAGDDREVWLSTLGGLARCDADGRIITEASTMQQEFGASYIYKILRDSKGRFWLGTDGRGLAVMEYDQIRYITEAAGVRIRTVYSIVEDDQGTIWFSADKMGLFSFDGLRFKHYTQAQRLHSLSISSLAADARGRIIIGYEDGFDELNPAQHGHFMFYDPSTGVPSSDVNLNAMCRDQYGHVWMGTSKGIVRAAAYDESFLYDPQPGFTSIQVFSQDIDYQKDNTFSHDENYFFFNFTGLWYTQPESVRYRYFLEGVDREWKVSKDHLASYSALLPGKYNFRLQTSEHGSFEGVQEINWQFEILPPVWQRWWFILLVLSLSAALLMWFIKTRDKRLKNEAHLKKSAVEAQFEALKSQINPHFLFNSFNTLITIIEESPKIAVEYVEHLSDFYRSIMAYREQDFIPVQEEMALVRNFYFLLQKRYETGLQLSDSISSQLAGNVMPLSVQILVENAVKHNVISPNRPLIIEIFSDADGYITVRNNIQRKITPEVSTHFGLQSLIRRYRLLGDKEVQVEDNAAYFTVRIPVITI